MTALYIILGILLFIFLLLLCPVRLDFRFQEEFSLTVRYLFLRLSVPAAREESPAEEPKKPKKEKKTEEGEKSGGQKFKELLKEKGLSGFLNALFSFVKLLFTSTKRIVIHLKLKRFDLYLRLAGAGDPGDAAILYGQLSGAVYALCGALFSLKPCEKKAVSVDLGYEAQENLVDFSATLSLLPLFAVREGFSLLFHSIPILLRFFRGGKKKAAAPSTKSTAVQTP